MKCNKCGHDNNDANKFCEKCGNSLEMRPTFCPKCGVELSDNAAFCPRCGAQIAQKGEFKTSQKNAPVVHKKSGSKIAIVIAIIVVLLAAGFVLWKFVLSGNKVTYSLSGNDNGVKQLVAKYKGKTIYSKVKHQYIEIGDITTGDDIDEIEIKAVDGILDGSKIVTFDKRTLEFFDDAKKIQFQRKGNKILIFEDVSEFQNGKPVKYTKQNELGSVQVVFDSPHEINTDGNCDNPNYEGLSIKQYDIDGDLKKDMVKFYQSASYGSTVQNYAADIVIQFANGKKSTLTSPANFVCIMKTKSLGVSDIITTAEGFKNDFSVYRWNGNYYQEVPKADFINQMAEKAAYKPEPESFYSGSTKYFYYPGNDGDDNQEKIFVELDGKKYSYRTYWQDGGIVEVKSHSGFDEIIFNWNKGNTAEGQSVIMFNKSTKNFTYVYNVPDKVDKDNYNNIYTLYYYYDSGTKKYTISDGSKNLKEVKEQSYRNLFDY